MCCTFFSLAMASVLAWSPDFGPPIPMNGVSGREGLIAADFNGDGNADIFGRDEAYLSVALGNGNGAFGDPILTPVEFPTLGYWDTIATGNFKIADFTGDGILDVAFRLVIYPQQVGPYNDPDSRSFVNIVIYSGDGAGGFHLETWIEYYDSDVQFEVGDISGDGSPDLFIIWCYSGYFAGFDTYVSNSGGGFDYANGGALPFGYPGIRPHLVADFNGDGKGDVFSQGLGFALSNGDGTFQSVPFPAGPWTADSFDVAGGVGGDFNGDGIPDLVSSRSDGLGWLVLGVGDGTFTAGPTFVSGIDARAADFNGDGIPDLVGRTAAYPPHPVVSLGTGGGAFSLPRYDGAVAYRAEPADFNGDGRPDLVVAGDDSLYVLLNDGDWTGAPTLPEITIQGNTVTEGNSGTTTPVAAWVKLSHPSPVPVTVRYATAAGDATPGLDYVESSGVVTFAPGETTQTIPVTIIGDLLTEQIYEYIVINLSDATGAVIADAEALCAIYNEEQPAVLSIDNCTKAEGNKGNVKFTFTVSMSGAIQESVSVSYRTADGAATTGDGDFSAASGTLTFSPGQTSKTITVNVRGDKKREGDEVFYVDLFHPSSNASIDQSRGTGTIVNDD
ncbi:MAG TPA: FG-GAP-like repeat-containing protein [Planctomycetia bacterium]|nr:FG-GAP-like repeat-containing protein [Planctomycetia bacterium]